MRNPERTSPTSAVNGEPDQPRPQPYPEGRTAGKQAASGPGAGTGARVPAPGRLDRLTRAVVRLARAAHVTADEFRYCYKRARQQLGLRGRPSQLRRLPEILTPEELSRILAVAYRERGVYGLIVRILIETGLPVSELCGVAVVDVDMAERTIRVREGRAGRIASSCSRKISGSNSGFISTAALAASFLSRTGPRRSRPGAFSRS